MIALDNLRETSIQMLIPQKGKGKRYNVNESSIAFVEGEYTYILPNVDVYQKIIEDNGYIYDSDVYIPIVDFE